MMRRFAVVLSGVVLALLLLVAPRQASAQSCTIGYSCMYLTGGITLGNATAITTVSTLYNQVIVAVDTSNYEALPSTCATSGTSSTTGACGYVSSDGTTYSISIIEPATFTDTLELMLQVTSGQTSTFYPLQTTTTGTNYTVAFAGTAITSVENLFSVADVTKALYVGGALSVTPVTEASTTSSSSSSTSSTSTTGTTSSTSSSSTTSTICPTAYANCDVNGDGVFDKNDINFIKNALSSRSPSLKADFNSDGVVNTQDVIDAMRALALWRANQLKGVVGSGTSSSTTTSGTSTSTGQ